MPQPVSAALTRPAPLARLPRALKLGLILGLHAACFAAVFTGARPADLALCVALYLARVFGVTAGYHRYFAHRSFKTSRAGQLALALLAMSSGHRGVLWWAWHHRHHHRTSDTPEDFHSPRLQGFWRAHLTWWMEERCRHADLRQVRDLARYPELRWLERLELLPVLALAGACWALGGWGTFVVGFCWSTVGVWHAVFSINSLAHVFGTQDFDTGDDSRNNRLLGWLLLGEGWHNNHHRFPSSAHLGFGPGQADPGWWMLRGLERLGLVWDLRRPPKRARESDVRAPHPEPVTALVR
ncbi:MAG: acyl-CoA desaturase [Alphaproteobacteria bacterium]|nr:acyl-CoA desaturase [Alphaproteobacteria bacterium]